MFRGRSPLSKEGLLNGNGGELKGGVIDIDELSAPPDTAVDEDAAALCRVEYVCCGSIDHRLRLITVLWLFALLVCSDDR